MLLSKIKLFLLFLLINIVFFSCSNTEKRIPFTINPDDKRIYVQVCLQDSIIANMLFDSGAVEGVFRLDSTFVSAHPSLIPEISPYRNKMQPHAGTIVSVPISYYDTMMAIKLGNTSFIYDNLHIYNMRKALVSDFADGIFNMPKNDTAHVWEWNFDHNHLKIHSAEDFKMPENSYSYPMKSQGYYAHYIQIPLQIIYAEGDTLSVKDRLLVDMGIPIDISFTYPSNEWQFFNQKDSSRSKCKTYGYGHFYNLKTKISNCLELDSSEIEIVDDAIENCLGLNFLKHFNLFFDQKHNILGLQPVKNYTKIDMGKPSRYKYSRVVTENYTFLVTRIGNYEENPLKKAGLQVGDEITEYNDIPIKSITNEQYEEFRNRDTLVYTILRNRRPLKIVVPISELNK